ncbi:MAG: hypothetical protein HONBIEJF_00687 [Fimbriimonadaceae bacterium]|nr:hypothetical protein [Fimbriimonadaceae bacterium]
MATAFWGRTRGVVVALLFCIPLVAMARPVKVEIKGRVAYNVIKGGLTNVKAGDPATMSFLVDSSVFGNNPFYPTRGYNIDLASFRFNVGGVELPISNPQPDGTAFFVLRDNDPAVDGFFMSQGELSYPMPVAVTIPGLNPVHELVFSRTFSSGNVLPSLDILRSLKRFGYEYMSSFQWTVGRFGTYGMEINYESIQLSANVVPVWNP